MDKSTLAGQQPTTYVVNTRKARVSQLATSISTQRFIGFIMIIWRARWQVKTIAEIDYLLLTIDAQRSRKHNKPVENNLPFCEDATVPIYAYIHERTTRNITKATQPRTRPGYEAIISYDYIEPKTFIPPTQPTDTERYENNNNEKIKLPYQTQIDDIHTTHPTHEYRAR